MMLQDCPYCESDQVLLLGGAGAHVAQCLACGAQWWPTPDGLDEAGAEYVHDLDEGVVPDMMAFADREVGDIGLPELIDLED